MKKTLFAGLAAGVLISAAHAQTTDGYLYYVAGAISDSADAVAEDGTLTGDNGVFSVLVADLSYDASTVSVSNWRYAHDSTNVIPEDNPNTTGTTEAYSWMFLENAAYVVDGRLYLGPGDWNGDASRDTADAIAWADIDPLDGSLGTWNMTDEFPSGAADLAIGGVAVPTSGNTTYYTVLGGALTSVDTIVTAAIQPGGGLAAFSVDDTGILAADWFNRATQVGDTIIHGSGNRVASRDVSYATIDAGGDVAAFTAAGTYSAGGSQWDYVMETVVSPDATPHVVIAGGSALDGGVYTAPVTAGVPGSFAATNSLPTSVRRVAGAAIDDLVFVMGGTVGGSSVSAATSEIQVGRIDNSGVVTWTDSTNDVNIEALPQNRAFGGSAIFIPPPGADVRDWSLY